MPTTNISVIVPLLNESESLPELSAWIERVMTANNFSYEVIMIDDGSTDNSWEVITSINKRNPSFRGIRFNRNYGKSAALDVGFHEAVGDVVITMDADLQDSPDEIPGLYKMIKDEKYDLVSGWKQKRYDPISKTIPSKFFNAVTRSMSGIQLNDFNCGLKAYNHRVVKTISVYGEMHRYIPVIAKWAGFSKIGEKIVAHQERKYGTTKFGLERFIYGFLDLLSISFVGRYKKRPMHFFGTLGILSFLLGFIITFWLIGEKVYDIYFAHVPVRRDVTDKPLFFISLVAIIAGIQMFLAGFIGEMMTQMNARKNDYIVSEKI
jgi:glycosyltransferase involved in cell wall biosynthesis